MDNELEIPVISYENIRECADIFLRQYHPTRNIPIPIEEIVEFQLGINIVPLPGLHQVLEVDGFTSSDMKSIFVDEFVYNSRPGRYRFTLAHEVGHVILHKNVYKKAAFGNIQEWKDFINSIPDQSHRWLEYHAYAFGGLILVPREHLHRLTDEYVRRIREEGLSLKEAWDFCWQRIAAQLAKDFEVSTQVIERRLEKEKVKEQYRQKQ